MVKLEISTWNMEYLSWLSQAYDPVPCPLEMTNDSNIAVTE